MTGVTFIDCFSVGLDELPKKVQGNRYALGAELAKHGRFSVFEATANQTIAHTMTKLAESGWFEFVPVGYPWTEVKLTDKGKAALGIKE